MFRVRVIVDGVMVQQIKRPFRMPALLIRVPGLVLAATFVIQLLANVIGSSRR